MVKTFKNYTIDELNEVKIVVGNNVNISNDVIFYNPNNIIIGENVRIDSQCIFIAGKNNKIVIGNNIHISAGCYFYGNSGDIVLEDFSTISGRCTIYTANDDYTEGYMTNPNVNIQYRKVKIGNVLIKKHTIIGCHSTILPGVVLEKATSVGSYSLVKKSTNEYDVIAGIPAKFLKKRKNIYLN
jgi:galactoside O-acetyltransferase